MKWTNQVISFAVIIFLSSCHRYEQNDISLGVTLVENNSSSENSLLRNTISEILDQGKDYKISELVKFDCGRGAGCYDLGNIIVNIIYRIGIERFLKYMESIDSSLFIKLQGLVSVGVQYGDLDFGKTCIIKGVIENFKIQDEKCINRYAISGYSSIITNDSLNLVTETKISSKRILKIYHVKCDRFLIVDVLNEEYTRIRRAIYISDGKDENKVVPYHDPIDYTPIYKNERLVRFSKDSSCLTLD